MTATWSPDELERIGSARELQIAVKRDDGTLRRRVPIWVVLVDEQVYVRTWYRRETGWFGHMLSSRRARIRVPGLEADVTVEDAGTGTDSLRIAVDAAYRTKYGSTSSTAAMVTPRSRRHNPAAESGEMLTSSSEADRLPRPGSVPLQHTFGSRVGHLTQRRPARPAIA